MNLAELERYFYVFSKLKDDKKKLPNWVIVHIILRYQMKPVEERTNDDGIAFLIANAIRKHRMPPYPKVDIVCFHISKGCKYST